LISDLVGGAAAFGEFLPQGSNASMTYKGMLAAIAHKALGTPLAALLR
jgi:hypothetical protein